MKKLNPKNKAISPADEIKEKLSQHLTVLKHRFPVERLALFGSVTREDFDPATSDIDILVEFNGAIGWEIVDLHEELETLLGRKVDLVSRRGIKPRYWEYMKEELSYV